LKIINYVFFGLIFLVVATTITFAAFIQAQVHHTMTFGAVPAENQLKTSSGTLEYPVHISGRRISWYFGMLREDSGQLLPFSCYPGDEKLDCLDGSGYSAKDLVGHHLTIKYFQMPNWLYPSFRQQSPQGSQSPYVVIPRIPASIIMRAELTDQNTSTTLLTYTQSMETLRQYASK
jgi:hypothetical protein